MPESLKAVKACNRAVALGFFDGVHFGHVCLLTETIAAAQANRLCSAVFTFTDLPLKTIEGTILTSEEKIRRLYAVGIEEVFAVSWQSQIYNLSPQDFVRKILVEHLQAKVVVCGIDFRFGRGAAGNVETLRELADYYDIEIRVVDNVMVSDVKVSSSLIRSQIKEGKMAVARQFLGYDYYLRGTVIGGRQIGRKLGFPTLNLAYPENLCLPHFGVYASHVVHRGEVLPSISSVGIRPTVADSQRDVLLETYVYDRHLDLYGQEIEVRLLKFIRSEVKFNSLAELVQQVESDKRTVLAYHLTK